MDAPSPLIQSVFSQLEESKRQYSSEMDKMREQLGKMQNYMETMRSRPGASSGQTVQIEREIAEESDEMSDGAIAPERSTFGQQTSNERTKRRILKFGAPHHGPQGDSSDDGGGVRGPPPPLWRKNAYDAMSSDEAHMFEDLHNELTRLGRHMETVEKSNSSKLEDAQLQIRSLQEELHVRDVANREAERGRALDAERTMWQEELDTARQSLSQLQTRLEERERLLEDGYRRTDKSLETISIQNDEIEALQDVLDAQRNEIQRLNGILDKLVGARAEEVHPHDVMTLQQDIHALRSSLGAGGSSNPSPYGSGYLSPQSFPQPSHVVSQPNLNQSEMQAAAYSSGHGRGHGHGQVPPNYTLGHMSYSTPALNQYQQPPHPQLAPLQEAAPPPAAPHPTDALLCNVPEHHNMEDYMAALQAKVRGLKRKLREKQDVDRSDELERLRKINELLESKKDEISEVDFELECGRAKLEKLREMELRVVEERAAANKELQQLNLEVEQKVHQSELYEQRSRAAQAELDKGLEVETATLQARQVYFRQELECLEESLTKRKTELVQTEKQLRDSKTDLEKLKETAAITIAQYEEARKGLEQANKEGAELEKRSREAANELLQTNNDVEDRKQEVLDLEAMKRNLEGTLGDIQKIIQSKDGEFQNLELRIRQASDSLARVNADLALTAEQEKEKLDLLAEVESMLGERRAELERLRMQADATRQDVDAVDKCIGQRRAELQQTEKLLERKQNEMLNLTRETEKVEATKQREIRELNNNLEGLQEDRKSLLKHIEELKNERDQLKEDADREQEVLQNLTSAINKQKAELKHLLEMLKLEQGELAKVNEQYQEKLKMLERTQAALHDQQAELSECEAQRKRKQAELERVRDSLQADQSSLEGLQVERRAQESAVSALNRERDMLQETSRSLEKRIGSMKKQQTALDENMSITQSKLDQLTNEASGLETQLSGSRGERMALQSELSSIAAQEKEAKVELNTARERLQEAESAVERLEGDLRSKQRERDDLQMELRRLGDQVRAAKLGVEEAAARQAAAEGNASRALHEVSQRQHEIQESSQNVTRLRREYEQEEQRMSRLMSSANMDLENVKADLHMKQEELEVATARLTHVKREMDQRNHTEDKFADLEKFVTEQDHTLLNAKQEKEQLAQNMNRTFRDLQSCREELAQERAVTVNLQDELRMTREAQNELQHELRASKKRTSVEMQELEKVAQEHCSRANRLAETLQTARADYLELRKQLLQQSEMAEQERRVANSMRTLRVDLHSDLSRSVEQLHLSSSSAVGELSDLAGQRNQLQRHLDTLKENLAAIRGSRSTPVDVNLGLSNGNLQDSTEDLTAAAKSQLRAKLHEAEVALTADSRRSAETMASLRRHLDDLEGVIGNGDGMQRQPFRDTNASVTSDKDKAERDHRDSHSAATGNDTKSRGNKNFM